MTERGVEIEENNDEVSVAQMSDKEAALGDDEEPKGRQEREGDGKEAKAPPIAQKRAGSGIFPRFACRLWMSCVSEEALGEDEDQEVAPAQERAGALRESPVQGADGGGARRSRPYLRQAGGWRKQLNES